MIRRAAALVCALMLLCAASCTAAAAPHATQGFAMDTAITLTVYGGDEALGADLLKAVSEVENLLSWNVVTSPVARLNREGSVKSAALADVLTPLLPLCEASGGEYTLLMRPLCALWNITAADPVVPSDGDIAALLPLCQGGVRVEGDTVCVPDGAQMDLGSVGKGVACDVLVKRLRETGKAGVFAVGGSIAVCGEKPDGSPWKIGVAAPDDRNRSVGTLTVREGEFVSTSGNGERYFEVDGVRYHHILSGNSGVPCDAGLNAVTVVADTGALADALSTVCFLLGEDKARPLLARCGAQAVFQSANGAITVTDGLKARFEVKS